MSSFYRKVIRNMLSAYYELRSRFAHYHEGFHGTDAIPHYSERCGWKDFGAHDEAEYDYWWREACGIVSLRMVLDAFDASGIVDQEPIFQQIQHAIKDGAYLQKETGGKIVRVGWIHEKLVELARKRDVRGRSLKLSTKGICYAIGSGKLVMASIYRPFSRFIDEHAPRKKAGGHLVVVRGFEWKDGQCTGLLVADPYDSAARKQAISPSLFNDIYSGSAIIFYK